MILLPAATTTSTVAAAAAAYCYYYSPRFHHFSTSSRLNQAPPAFVLRKNRNNKKYDDSMICRCCCHCLPPVQPPLSHHRRRCRNRQHSSSGSSRGSRSGSGRRRQNHWTCSSSSSSSTTELFSSMDDDDHNFTEERDNHFDFRTYQRKKQKHGLDLLEILVLQQAALALPRTATAASSFPSSSFRYYDDEDDRTTKIPVARFIDSLPSTVVDQSASKMLKRLWKRQNNKAWIDSDDSSSSSSSSINNNNRNNDQSPTNEGSEEHLGDCLVFGPCQLHGGRSEQIHRISREIDPLISTTFENAQQSMKAFGYSTELTRYDLFHGHIFEQRNLELNFCSSISSSVNATTTIALFGILFHCAEYPAVFPLPLNDTLTNSSAVPPHVEQLELYHDTSNYHNDKDQEEQNADEISTPTTLGYCQDGSTCRPSLEEWRFRNLLWVCWWNVTSDDETNYDDDEKNSKVDNGKVDEAKKKIISFDDKYDDGHTINQAMWHLDGQSLHIANLRVDDGETFGPECTNTVYEGFLGDSIGDVFYLNGELFFACADHT